MSDQSKAVAVAENAPSETFRVQIDLFGGGRYVIELHGSRNKFIGELFSTPACLFHWGSVVEYAGVNVPEGATIALSTAAIVQFVICPAFDVEVQP